MKKYDGAHDLQCGVRSPGFRSGQATMCVIMLAAMSCQVDCFPGLRCRFCAAKSTWNLHRNGQKSMGRTRIVCWGVEVRLLRAGARCK